MIVFQKITKTFKSGQVVALKNVSLEISQGEFLSLVGKSGAGKSTLLALITLEERPDSGRILIEGQDLSAIKPADSFYLRRKIGVVYQDIKLLPRRTAAENVAFAMEVSGLPDAAIIADVPKILDLVGLKTRGGAFPNELSGGEKQRVAIARALVNRPDVILADEPTGNLDPINTWEIIKLLQKINSLGKTVILATHDKEIINSLDRRVVVLDKGEVISDKENGKYLV